MRILILGATGFIGNAIFHALIGSHDITIGGRSKIAGFEHWRKVDFSEDNNFEAILENIDMVINTIGIISGDFKKIQTESPLKLFKTCQRKSIKIINISAVGAEKDHPKTLFLQTKKQVDDFIISETDGKVVYPGIVLGKDAQSTRFFKELSTLPLIPLLGHQKMALVHISQLTGLIKHTVEKYEQTPAQIFALSQPETLQDVLNAMRKTKGKYVQIPTKLVAFLFTLFPTLSLGMFNKNMFSLLQTVDPYDYEITFDKATKHLDKSRLVPSHFLLKDVGILSLAFIWLWSGVISLISWNQSMALMAKIHITNPSLAGLSIYAGCLADILLGIGVLLKGLRTKVLLLQLLFIVAYTVILCVGSPSIWLKPFGPLSKNIPIMALIYIMYQWEKKRFL